MAQAIDLSTLKNKKRDVPDYDDLSPEEQEAIDRAAKASEDSGESVKTAFVVVVHNDGHAEISGDVSRKFDRKELPTPQIIQSTLSSVLDDMHAQKTASVVVSMMNQIAQAQMEQMQNSALMKNLDPNLGRQ